MFLETLATVLHVSRKTFRRLRESRKCLEELFGVCGSPASVTRNFLAFAGVPQVSRRIFRRLRESRKCLEELFGVCGSPASVSRNFLAFAGAPQVSRRTFWRLRESRKHFQKRFGPRVASVEALCLHRTHVNRKRDPPRGTFVCLIVSWSPKRIAEWASTDN